MMMTKSKRAMMMHRRARTSGVAVVILAIAAYLVKRYHRKAVQGMDIKGDAEN